MKRGERHKVPVEYGIALGLVVMIVVMRFLDMEIGRQMGGNLWLFSRQMIVLVPCIFALIGLMDVWIPNQWIQQRIGEGSGLKGAIYVVMLAVFQGGPLYGAFPVAHLLWKKGCSIRNVFIYLGAFSTLKAPMMLFEAAFLGWKFTLVRSAVALPVFIFIAEVMAAYSRRTGVQMNQLEADG